PFSGLARAWQYTVLLDTWERNIRGRKSFPGDGSLSARPARPLFLAAEKGRKRLPAGAHKIQFYAARFTTRYRSDK
ncbi:hypothetical protein, partial [Candidatus Avelusimicrobium alvi]|uniref:hypothetical protein n=1 Tax=Candidatus Avelusimicrobium alvi TaxID=3416221 RepID=UPI003D0A5CB4